MKALNKLFQVLAVVFGLAALVLFFFPFAKFGFADGVKNFSGMQIAFGSKVYNELNIAKSSDVLFCFLTSVLSVALSVFTFFAKSRKVSYFASGFTLGTAIYMLVITLSNPWKFVDTRPFTALLASGIDYAPFVLFTTVALLFSAACAIAFMFLNDYLAVVASKGSRQFLLKRILQFFKDYKSECKKIVWPGMRDVVKNTAIVLVMCLVIGLLIWLVDWGLGSLLKLVL